MKNILDNNNTKPFIKFNFTQEKHYRIEIYIPSVN